MTQISFKIVCQHWQADKKPYVKASTMAAYALTVRTHLKPNFEYLEDVTPQRVQELVDQSVEKGMSLSYVKGILVVLKMIMRYAERQGWIGTVSMDVRFPQNLRKRNPPAALPIKEEKLIVEYLINHPTNLNLGLLICLCCGLRIGEVCALRWGDVDLFNRVIHVSSTVYRIYHPDGRHRKTELVIGMPKTATSLRDVPITDFLYNKLKRNRRRHNPKCFLASGKATPADPQTFRNNFKRVSGMLGLSYRRVHILRHTFATRCIEVDCDYKTLSSLLGHSDVSTTLNLYVHPNMERKMAIVEKMMKTL